MRIGDRVKVLQRGRSPKTAEIGPQTEPTDVGERASTGPQSEDRGDYEVERVKKAPVALQRGRSPKTAEIASPQHSRFAPSTLQRGRSPKTAEIPKGTTFISSFLPLQRGRSPKTAEIAGRPSPGAATPHRFNGAAVRRPRR